MLLPRRRRACTVAQPLDREGLPHVRAPDVYATPGKLEELHARFRNHTIRLFKKHGMTIVGFWAPTAPADAAAHTLVYVLAYPSDRPGRRRGSVQHGSRVDCRAGRIRAKRENCGEGRVGDDEGDRLFGPQIAESAGGLGATPALHQSDLSCSAWGVHGRRV